MGAVLGIVMFLISVGLVISGIVFAAMSYTYKKKAKARDSDYRYNRELEDRYLWFAVFTLFPGLLLLYAVLLIASKPVH